MAVGLASAERARDYGSVACRICGETFQRRSGSATVCQRDECQRARRQQAQRKHERKRKQRRRLRPVEGALRDLALQLAYDAPHPISYAQIETRWAALTDGRQNMCDPAARTASRQLLLDLAAASIRVAAELPAPTVAPRLESGQRERVRALVDAAV